MRKRFRNEEATARKKRILATLGQDAWDAYKTEEAELREQGLSWPERVMQLAPKYGPTDEDIPNFPSTLEAKKHFKEKMRNDNAMEVEPDKDAGYESVDKLRAIDWVAAAFGTKNVKSEDAPNPMAWAIYEAYKSDRIQFFNNFFSKTLPSSRQIELIGFADNRKGNSELFTRLDDALRMESNED